MGLEEGLIRRRVFDLFVMSNFENIGRAYCFYFVCPSVRSFVCCSGCQTFPCVQDISESISVQTLVFDRLNNHKKKKKQKKTEEWFDIL